jgi:hypothetical protein
MRVDLLYLAFNRLAFTRLTFETLLANTDWNLVDRLLVYDDGSEDGTRAYLDAAIGGCPVDWHLVHAGWTQHQWEYKPVRGWVKPDLRVCSLDQLPFEPWQSLAAEYVSQGWARAWPAYFERWMHGYWDWCPQVTEAASCA